ncbi:MAG: hypothetical protein ACRDJE_16825, partial [Dehalococcoidia bacterium]
MRPLEYAAINPTSGGVYRIEGDARDGPATLPWSLIVKIVRAPHRADPAGHTNDSSPDSDPARLEYWRREVLAYRSGLFDGWESGLRAARCHGITEYADDAAAIWLEDLSGHRRSRWDAADEQRVAEDLGWFSARHTERPPPYRWLHRGCLRILANSRRAAVLDLITRPETWQHPLTRRHFPEPIADRLLRVWEERPLSLDALDRLPQTVCHFDISRHNLFLVERSDGRRGTVAIDWASVGIGAVGEDLSLLVPSPFFRLEEDVQRLPRQAEVTYEAYLHGLKDAGWRGVERDVRLGYTIAIGLRTVFIAPTLRALSDAQAREYEERRWGASIEVIIAQRAPLT